jgi:hypothetical protein
MVGHDTSAEVLRVEELDSPMRNKGSARAAACSLAENYVGLPAQEDF